MVAIFIFMMQNLAGKGGVEKKLSDTVTLNRPASDQSGVWPSRGAGPFTSEIPQTVRDSTSLSAQR